MVEKEWRDWKILLKGLKKYHKNYEGGKNQETRVHVYRGWKGPLLWISQSRNFQSSAVGYLRGQGHAAATPRLRVLGVGAPRVPPVK